MSQFKTFVRELDQATLEQLRRQVATEMEQRRQETAVQIDDIHPRMSAEDKARAALEIARILGERG
ncbi:MAG TPA: hypothetical protein VIX12_06120 [Candidatus Binataceae bacterium]